MRLARREIMHLKRVRDCTALQKKSHGFKQTTILRSIVHLKTTRRIPPPQQECTRMRLNSSSSSESLSPPPYTINLHPDCRYTGSNSGRRYLQALVPSGSLEEAKPNLKVKNSTSGKFYSVLILILFRTVLVI